MKKRMMFLFFALVAMTGKPVLAGLSGDDAVVDTEEKRSALLDGDGSAKAFPACATISVPPDIIITFSTLEFSIFLPYFIGAPASITVFMSIVCSLFNACNNGSPLPLYAIPTISCGNPSGKLLFKSDIISSVTSSEPK